MTDPFDGWRARIDAALEAALSPPLDAPPRLHAAMRHAVLLGGKRMRPLLVHATGAVFDADPASFDAPAVAVELVHAYSLVHDDLPCMDDDALRRGQPTVHVAFDEATAVLAGDALQSLAFAVLATTPVDATVRVAMIAELAGAAGATGMCGGQALDIEATGRGGALDLSALERLHRAKTGTLLRCAVRLGALAAGASPDARERLDRYAGALGLAFQVRDDLLDIEAASDTLGKTPGKDAAQAKATFPAVIGAAASRARLSGLASEMDSALSGFGPEADALRALGRRAIERSH
ncbi:polyprenyl synthetase family protein [Luteimonas pelagia]